MNIHQFFITKYTSHVCENMLLLRNRKVYEASAKCYSSQAGQRGWEYTSTQTASSAATKRWEVVRNMRTFLNFEHKNNFVRFVSTNFAVKLGKVPEYSSKGALTCIWKPSHVMCISARRSSCHIFMTPWKTTCTAKQARTRGKFTFAGLGKFWLREKQDFLSFSLSLL